MRISGTLVKILSLALLATITACAKQGYPSGGPKDTAPPQALESKPANETRNFAEQQFFIGFNEYVVIKDANNNVLISPPMKQKPEFTTKGKGILVKIKDTLLENTTYLFQFKDAIADFTEGNVLSSYEYVFSTGEAMDTMMLAGHVLNARNGKPWKERVTVMAYKEPESEVVALNDTLATSVQPDFVTRCDKEGFFAFHYIPAGNYRLVALEDKDRNLLLGVTEAAAWCDTAVASADSIDSTALVSLQISLPPTQKQRIVKAEFTAKGRIVINTLLPMKQPRVTSLSPAGDSTSQEEKFTWRLTDRRDTLILWCADPNVDSATVVVSDEQIQDTLKLRYRAGSRKGRKGRKTVTDQEPLVKALCAGNNAFYDDLWLAFATPIVRTADTLQAQVMYLKDSSVSTAPMEMDSNGLRARILATLKSGEQYQISLADSLFFDLYGNANDSLSFSLKPKDYGTLTLHIDNRTGYSLVIEVLDNKDTVIKHAPLLPTLSTLRFPHLAAGQYRLRAVVDRNGDGMWTPGEYPLQRQPEESFYFDKTLQLREKWEMEENWIVGNVELKAESDK